MVNMDLDLDLDLEECEMEKKSLGNMYETLNSQASSVLVFALKWKELEERLDSISNHIHIKLKELHEKEQILNAKELVFECKANEHQRMVKELAELDALVDEKRREAADAKIYIKELSEVEKRTKERLEKSKEELDMMERKIEEKGRIFDEKIKEEEKRVVDMEKEDIMNKVRFKIKEQILSQKSMKELRCNLERKERELQEIEEKLLTERKDFDDLNKKTNEMCEKIVKKAEADLEEKGRQLEKAHQGEKKKLEKSHQEREKQLEFSYQECKKKLEKCHQEGENQLHQELMKKLETKERQHQELGKKLEAKVRLLEDQGKKLESSKKLHQEAVKKLEAKERHLVEQGKELESEKKQNQELVDQLKSEERKLEEQGKELESTKKRRQELVDQLEAKERKLVEQGKELEFTKAKSEMQQLDAMKKQHDQATESSSYNVASSSHSSKRNRKRGVKNKDTVLVSTWKTGRSVPPEATQKVETFIRDKKLDNAYELIHKYKLSHKFPTNKVFKEFVNNVMTCMKESTKKTTLSEQEAIVDKAIGDLQSAVKFIQVHNLKADYYNAEYIEQKILLLQNFKENQRCENGRKRLCRAVVPNFEQQGHNKLQRTSLHHNIPNPNASFHNGGFGTPSNNHHPMHFQVPPTPLPPTYPYPVPPPLPLSSLPPSYNGGFSIPTNTNHA